MRIRCKQCGGSGANNLRQCHYCVGRGHREEFAQETVTRWMNTSEYELAELIKLFLTEASRSTTNDEWIEKCEALAKDMHNWLDNYDGAPDIAETKQ